MRHSDLQWCNIKLSLIASGSAGQKTQRKQSYIDYINPHCDPGNEVSTSVFSIPAHGNAPERLHGWEDIIWTISGHTARRTQKQRHTDGQLVSWWVLWAQSTTKDYIRAKNKLQSISKLFVPQVIIPQVSFSRMTIQILSTIVECKPIKTITCVLDPIYILLALNTGTCTQQGDLFYSVGLHRNRC